MKDVFWPGIIAMAVMYAAVFAVGVFSSRGQPEPADGDAALEELMLAGRSLPMWVALLTMTATWVGGGYINGTAEQAYSAGVMWGGQAGIGYAISLLVGGLFYAKVMRRAGYATLIDPFEVRYGPVLAAVMMVPAILAELFWSAAILVALGSTVGTVIGLDLQTAIIGSSAVAVGYTLFGGLRAVAYTDVFQLFLIAGGLLLALPFVLSAAGGLTAVLGSVEGTGIETVGATLSYADWTLLLIFGGIPWNVYFQRVLSSTDEITASKTSMYAGVICAIMALPPLLIGLAATQIDWNSFGPGLASELQSNPAMVLPYTLRYAVPEWVAVVGLGAVSAAVMSSVDSSILSGASLIAWNGYRRLISPNASAQAVGRLLKVLIVLLGTSATIIALTVSSISALWYLCGDIVYCVLFPQLTLVLFDSKANRIGAITGLVVSGAIRLSGGDQTLGLPALVAWPLIDGAEFPFRTIAMLTGLVAALVASRLTQQWDKATPICS